MRSLGFICQVQAEWQRRRLKLQGGCCQYVAMQFEIHCRLLMFGPAMPWCPGIKPKFWAWQSLTGSNRQTPELDWPTRMEIHLTCSKTQCPQHSAASSYCVSWCCVDLRGVAFFSLDGFNMLEMHGHVWHLGHSCQALPVRQTLTSSFPGLRPFPSGQRPGAQELRASESFSTTT